MGRVVQQLEGLALAGRVTVGPVAWTAPGVAWAGTELPPSGLFELTLAADTEAPVGRRVVELRGPSGRVRIDYPVPVPEASGEPGALTEASTGAWVVHWPLAPGQWETLASARAELIVLGNARALLRDGEPFVRAIRELRQRAGSAPALWAPRVALPHRLAFLAYLGIDLLDTTEGRGEAAGGIVANATLGPLGAGGPGPRAECDCAECRSGGPAGEAHVAATFDRELRLVRAALAHGRLRELVEARLTAEPALAELLRYTDRDLGALLEERTPVVGTEVRGYVLRESTRRPEVRRFLDRLVTRYRPPPSKEVLLLLPCSRTKPYRSSPSHRRYLAALDGLPRLARLHVVSVTSPLGLVPRELEDVYPARQYDIPVTGEWDEEERRRVLRALQHLLDTGRYRAVVVHLDPNEYAFVRGATFPSEVVWSSSDDRTLSPEALESLRAQVARVLEPTAPVPGGPLATVREELQEIAAFQFGRDGAERLFAEPIRLVGRPWAQRVQDGQHTDLASWQDRRGLFHLTVAGGERLRARQVLEVEVAADIPLQGDLFTPGVVRADPAIRIGDAVVLVRNASLVGVGEAALPGPLMRELPHGLAVRVRHRPRSGTSGGPTAT